jgi:hypothetical protein
MAGYQAKTRVEAVGIAAFVAGIEPPGRQAKARRLVQLFREVTGFEPRVHTGGMVGFGSYAYTYATGHSGVSLATGFAARKADLSIHVLPGYGDFGAILARLGKHRAGKSCLYLRHLDDADEGVLRELILAGLHDLERRWPVTPT